MKRSISILTLLFLLNHLHAQDQLPDSVHHIQVQRLNDSYIDVYVHIKHPDKRMPILIFCQGSGYDSNTKGFLGLAAEFSDQVVGLVIEKQGVKYGDRGDKITKEYKEHNTVYNRLYDYLRVLQYLKANVTWWSGSIFIIGGSEGGLLAGMLASFYPDTRGLAILCYGGGMKFGESWPASLGLQKKEQGGNNAAIKKEEALAKDSIEYARVHANFSQSYSGDDNTLAWWASSTDLRLSNSLIDLTIPIFVGQGTEDLMALPASAKKLQQDFIDKKKTNLYLKEYQGYNHSFTDKDHKNHLVEVYLEAIDWMMRNRKKGLLSPRPLKIP